MHELSAGQLRAHAQLLKERCPAQKDIDMALAQVAIFDAQADLLDAQTGETSGVADSCALRDTYPLIGDVIREGGKITSIEHPITK